MVLPGYIVEAATRETEASDLETLQDWLDDGGDINDVDDDGDTILHMSISFECLEVVKWAIACGADVNQGDRDGDPPLYFALASGQTDFIEDVVSALLDAGANIDARTTATIEGAYIAGETALSYAFDWFRYDRAENAERGLTSVSLLLRRGAKLDNCWGGRSAEECLRHVEDPSAFPEHEGAYAIVRPPTSIKKQLATCKKLIADERRRRYMLPRRAFLRLRSLALRRRAKPETLLASVARLPNELAWHVLSFWPAEADVAPPSTPSQRS